MHAATGVESVSKKRTPEGNKKHCEETRRKKADEELQQAAAGARNIFSFFQQRGAAAVPIVGPSAPLSVGGSALGAPGVVPDADDVGRRPRKARLS